MSGVNVWLKLRARLPGVTVEPWLLAVRCAAAIERAVAVPHGMIDALRRKRAGDWE